MFVVLLCTQNTKNSFDLFLGFLYARVFFIWYQCEVIEPRNYESVKSRGTFADSEGSRDHHHSTVENQKIFESIE